MAAVAFVSLSLVLVLGIILPVHLGFAEHFVAITITASGDVEGTSMIQRSGNTYTFIGNIIGSITIQRDNIVVDGAGYTLQGTGNWIPVGQPYVSPAFYDYQGPENETGVRITGRTNVTIMNIALTHFYMPINLNNASYNIISGNTIMYSDNPIEITNKSSNNKIIGNRIENNSIGIILLESSDNTISENTIKISLRGGVIIGGDVYQSLNNRISGNYIGHHESDGIRLAYGSSSTIIIGNIIISNNPNGIYVMSGSNVILNNVVENSGRGIYLDSPGNFIAGNTIIGNTRIGIAVSDHNRIYHNNFIDNTKQVTGSNPTNIWNNGTTGNYWSDYVGRDEDDDGVGDTPYLIEANSQDQYPLMQPNTFPEPITETTRPEPFLAEWILVLVLVIGAIVGVIVFAYLGKRKR